MLSAAERSCTQTSAAQRPSRVLSTFLILKELFVYLRNTMPIKPFSFPIPETRFLHTTKYVYKFKIRYGVLINSEDTENKEHIVKELLDSIRAILANHDNLHPFSTKHFIIFPYKSKWDSASRLRFKHGHRFLLPFPYVFTIYIEPYPFVYESCPWKSSEENNQPGVEDMQASANSSNVDSGVSQISSNSEKVCKSPCLPMDHDTENGGGLWQFLLSFPPLSFLFGRRHSE
ncbi:membrane-anchored junction protein isoform X2 [Mixophyes fleayi]|uniref:membrane-anchored junction protein isoform X2 n=1 Tax=Mixophyes fleayi TaxID=3061075 RepID=UPI003F4E05D8